MTGSDGNMADVERGAWLTPHKWLEARKRRAEQVRLGPLQPNADNMKVTAYMGLIAKITLPVIAIETTSRPQTQMALSAGISLLAALIYGLKPPFMSPIMNIVVLTPRILHTLGFTVGLMAVLLHSEGVKDPMWPVLLLYCGAAMILISCTGFIIWQLRPHPASEDTASVPLMRSPGA